MYVKCSFFSLALKPWPPPIQWLTWPPTLWTSTCTCIISNLKLFGIIDNQLTIQSQNFRIVIAEPASALWSLHWYRNWTLIDERKFCYDISNVRYPSKNFETSRFWLRTTVQKNDKNKSLRLSRFWPRSRTNLVSDSYFDKYVHA